MKRILNIYYCWDEIGNANSNQNRRQHSVLGKLFDSTVIYRQFTGANYGERFTAVKSLNLLLFDRIFLKLFQSFKLVFSAHIWYWGVKAQKRVKDSFDVVLLTGTPYMLMGMASRIARRVGAKVVVQMYDPLAMNNYVGGSSIFRKKKELQIMKLSDAVIVHSKLMCDLMREQYPVWAHKLHFVPFSSDPDFVPPTNIVQHNERVTLIHAGNLQGDRNIDLLIDALEKLTLEQRLKINIQLIGNTSKTIKERIKSYHCFDLLPFMPKVELFEYYNRADALLAVDSFRDGQNIFFPSKVCEYFTLKKPILLMTPKISETRRVFTGAEQLCFGEAESDKLKNAILALIDNRTIFDSIIDYTQVEQFLPENTAIHIAGVINKLFGDE